MSTESFLKKLSKIQTYKGKGKVEVLACKEIIEKALEAKYPLTAIYNQLKEEEKLTIKYTMFSRHIKNLIIK